MRIVLIEDDRHLLRSLETILRDLGLSVMSFHNAEAAIFFLNLRPIMDVLVIDYQLKTMTAKYLMKRLKDVLPKKCKVILISGYADLIKELNLKELGIDVFLPKPLDLDKLLSLIDKIDDCY